MSSFKRKGATKAPTLPSYPGTRPSPASSSTIITSTGIPSLDDILGGGLPLSCSMLILAPDLHSSYGSLVQKYFVAEGLASGHRVVVVDSDPGGFARDIMWYPKGSAISTSKGGSGISDIGAESDDERMDGQDQKIKIAWRYEQMKQFQTSVKASSLSSDDYCHTFDLSIRVPDPVIEAALRVGNLSYLEVARTAKKPSTTEVLCRLSEILTTQESTVTPIRICIPSLGSPFWGSLTRQDLSFFLYSLRSTLRKHPLACASVCLPPHISTETWGGAGWQQRLGWLSDATISLDAFSADPSLSAIFPSHHGITHIEALPTPHMLVPPSDRFSTLRGLSASSSASGGGGENNLAFKCTRKRLIFETLHLDVEGGVSERRTTPAVSSDIIKSTVGVGSGEGKEQNLNEGKVTHLAKVDVRLEHENDTTARVTVAENTVDVKPKKKKKSVAFQSDRPDLYDF
ncbi:PAXNEB-domain-containing protein [Macrolepiota fuliginosa MF-IS2]|uniref:Elongator complex protein 4 n=1 Tax=Macrolepiota fuliginosa MF-IS2 TaxID=1400762 RepID=A0A9P6CB88_9AGAR|nr:PAXNEB-domain-containing protein [Macrolepiota fuliginosa MF-IS2]